VTQLYYYDLGDEPWTWWDRPRPEPGGPGIEVRHGYTMADMDRAVRMALARNVGVNAFTRTERYEIAWSAVALALCEADLPPTMSDLASAGWQAVSEARLTEMRHHGKDFNRRVGQQRPSFDRYWYWHSGPAGSPEPAIVERLALHQIWPLLAQSEQEALTALAVHGTVLLAAAATGVSRPMLHKRIRAGRLSFQQHWFQGETPPPRRTRDRRTASGEPCGDGYRAARKAARRRGRQEQATPCEATA
jgi:hypothetical protein